MKNLQGQKGFTLVELAIVLTIIGLLIGGILKGQQLVTNARVTTQIAQVQSIDAATTSFKDVYGSLPGDLANASARLPNCSGLCVGDAAAAGSGDGVVGPSPVTFVITGGGSGAVTAMPASGTEVDAYFPQLAAGGLIANVSGAATVAGSTAQPAAVPVGKIGGIMEVGTATDGYLYVVNSLKEATAIAAGTGTMTPASAMAIDSKMDDGSPSTGTVFGDGPASCYAAAATVYLGTTTTKDCGQAYRIQN